MKNSILAILFIAVVLVGCNSTGCLDNGSALPLAGFYSSRTGDAIYVDSIIVRGLGAPGDSALLDTGSRRASQVYLPMNPASSSVDWLVEYCAADLRESGLKDTITFTYTTSPYFASAECGAMYIYRIEDVACTTWLIDSVQVIDPLITNVDIERIKIFFRTADPEEEGEQ